MLTGNKGEWSEIYVLLKLLGDGKLWLGDEQLNRLTAFFYPVVNIIRSETRGTSEFACSAEYIELKYDDINIQFQPSQFREKALELLTKIKAAKKTFAVPSIEAFMSEINCFSLKADASVKSDIKITIHDFQTNQQPTLGFSIKSQLGSPATLLNASQSTNFIYELEGGALIEKEIDAINSIEGRQKVQKRLKKIFELGASLKFKQVSHPIFYNNLILIDSDLPKILAEMLLLFASSSFSKMSELLDKIQERNPLKYDQHYHHPFYSYKIKRFLTDVALGLQPSKLWEGNYEATGGYLVVKEDGEVLCYHLYNKTLFENYLVFNTKLDTPSTSRHDFAYLYKEDGKLFFKLNLQIRFLK